MIMLVKRLYKLKGENKMINIIGVDKRKLLASLYDNTKPQGMGFLHFDPAPLTEDEITSYLNQTMYFDYLKGRVMKVDLAGDEIDPYGYDRDNGEGACYNAIKHLL